jgi:transcriptional regulator with XRE-family HTH domain
MAISSEERDFFIALGERIALMRKAHGITQQQLAEVITNCDHLQKLKYSKALPLVFTEHGAIQAANVLASAQAVEMGIYVVRAFVQLRQAAVLHAGLAKRLTRLELTTERLEMSHDTFSRNTRAQLR